MIRIAFIAPNREIIRFQINNRIVKYFDKNWKEGLVIMPLEAPEVRLQIKKMCLSRKKTVSAMGLLIVDANQGKNKEEYDKCSTDKEIAELIRKDCLNKGLMEIK